MSPVDSSEMPSLARSVWGTPSLPGLFRTVMPAEPIPLETRRMSPTKTVAVVLFTSSWVLPNCTGASMTIPSSASTRSVPFCGDEIPPAMVVVPRERIFVSGPFVKSPEPTVIRPLSATSPVALAAVFAASIVMPRSPILRMPAAEEAMPKLDCAVSPVAWIAELMSSCPPARNVTIPVEARMPKSATVRSSMSRTPMRPCVAVLGSSPGAAIMPRAISSKSLFTLPRSIFHALPSRPVPGGMRLELFETATNLRAVIVELCSWVMLRVECSSTTPSVVSVTVMS